MRAALLLLPVVCVLSQGCHGCNRGAAQQDRDAGPSSPDATPSLDGGGALDGVVDLARGADLLGDATVDTSSPSDLLAPATTTLRPTWLQRVDGVDTRHFARELSSGEVLWLLNQGYGSPEVVYGKGEANETSVVGMLKPTLAWLDGSDGHLVRVRPIAGDHPETTGVAQALVGFVESRGGEISVGGELGGGVVLNPGTALAQPLLGPRGEGADELYAAIDPFVARYSKDGEPLWVMRGATPGPIHKTWFNQPRGLVALGDNELGFLGVVDGSGLALGADTASPVTIPEAHGAFLVRLDGSGTPSLWQTHHDLDAASSKLAVANDGSLRWLFNLPGAATLNASSASPTEIAPESGMTTTWVAAKLAPDGSIAWLRRLSSTGTCYFSDSVLRGSGALVIAGYCTGSLVIKDEALVPLGPPIGVTGSVVLQLGDDGSVAWSRAQEGAALVYSGLVETSDGALWLGGALTGDGPVLPLDNAPPLQLPPHPAPVDQPRNYVVLYRLSDLGERAEARLLGFDVQGQLAATKDGGILLATSLSASMRPAIFGGDGALLEQPRCTVPWDACALLLRFDLSAP